VVAPKRGSVPSLAGERMVGGMLWDVAAVVLIVFTPLVLVVADCFGNTILAAMERRRGRHRGRHNPGTVDGFGSLLPEAGDELVRLRAIDD